jgi:putative solute:sodium symporter small subunit
MKRELPDSPIQDVSSYWRGTRRLTALLLSIWFLSTFGVIFFARSLSELTLFGWTFSYYMAAQGILLIYVLIVGAYAWRMSYLDRQLRGGNRDDA